MFEEILGLIISILVFVSLIVMLIIYIVSGLRKKYEFANGILMYSFLHQLLSIALLSWALIVMNNGFDIVFSLRVTFEYTLIFLIPCIVVFGIIDRYVRKRVVQSPKKSHYVARYILPFVSMIALSVCVLLFYFNINYFVFLITW